MNVRTVLTNLGSLGNIQPFLALGAELRRYGYDPVFALAPQYGDYVRKLDFEFVPVGWEIDYQNLQKRDTASELRGGDPLHLFRKSLGTLSAMLPEMYAQLNHVCRRADLLLSGHLQPVSRIIHELTRIPFVSVHTSHFGGLQPPTFRQTACAIINPFRAKCGLPPVQDPIHTDANSDQLALYAMSRYLRPPGPNWPSHYHVTGFFFLPEEGLDPDPGLTAFVEAGPPAVVFTFSSIVHEDPRAITELLLEALDGLDCRAVILSGWSRLGGAVKMPPWVHVAPFVQHSWLFPRAACVVHAGGSGTTAMTLRSGIPAIVVPHVGDQPIWAELVRGIGCAKYVLPYQGLNARQLREALSHTLNDPFLYRNAASMAVKIREEQGVASARRLIDQLVFRAGPGTGPKHNTVSIA
jgi:UDP:flavonoid glycosyltransferase YjiC (YdhE family)